jgi:RNA polymerase sigma-70 factor (ECF subfamily)
MLRKRYNSILGDEADIEAIPQAELWYATSKTGNLEEQIGQIFEALRTPVYQYLLSVFGQPNEAEDLTQDAFLQLYRTLLKGQEINNVRFWIFRVAHNLALDKLKHKQFVSAIQFDSWDEVEKLLPDNGLNPEQLILRKEKFERIYQGLKKLTLNERQCLYLRSEGFRYKEIAEIMKVGVPTVGEYLRRSIKKLGEQVND